jgi:hypothetical protein
MSGRKAVSLVRVLFFGSKESDNTGHPGMVPD